MKWVITSNDELIPEWLSSNINIECPYCGAPIENGYNIYDECTRRRCSNKQCVKMIGERIGEMCTLLGYAGVKGGIGLQYASTHNLSSHFEAIPLLYKEEKPKVSLAMFLRCACIYGINTEFDNIAGTYSTVEELLNNYKGKHLSTLLKYKDLLLSGEKYFEIVGAKKLEKKYDTLVTGDIVITGVIPGFADRDKFVYYVNALYKGLVMFGYSRSKRKTGLYCCIAEDKGSMTGKIQEARAGGYPVYTVAEFFNSVNNDIVNAGGGDSLNEIIKERRK